MMIHSEQFLRLVDDAKQRIVEITVEAVYAKQQQNENFEFVDIREDSEWMLGKAEGAIHLGRGIIERDIEKMIPDKNAEIVLYCGGGYRSALAADNLQRMGYTNVKSMAGGIKLWSERGFPVVP
jgi:rhodanese-related sulfurtransferase